MKTTVVWTLFLVTSLSGAAQGLDVDQVANPREQGLWVSDLANMIDPVLESKLNQLLEDAHRQLTVEIVVVTVNSVSSPTPKDFATDLFNAWGIGHKQTDNGLLILMVQDARRLEMETGYGVETALPDGWLKSMQEAEMVPRFKEGKFGEGLFAGAEKSIKRMHDHRDGLVGTDEYEFDVDVPWWAYLGLAGPALFLGVGLKRRLERQCPECKKRMKLLPEDEEDIHLDEGQIREEELGSVDWQFWYCDDCDESRLLRVAKMFSGFTTCRLCKYKTMKVTSRTVVHPTYHAPGKAEVMEDCKHCNYHRVIEKYLPVKAQPTSSGSSSGGSSGGGGSSSGGGSFGGGSSGGGGAGSSW